MARMRVRLGALALAGAGVLFVFYPAIRPYSDETSLEGAAAFASNAWIVAHVLAMLAFVLVALGLLALYRTLQDTPAEGLAFLTLITTWIGVGLTLPYYGAEAFGLHAVGQAVADHLRLGPLRRCDFGRVDLEHPRGGRGVPEPDGSYGRDEGLTRDDPRRLRTERSKQPDPRQR